MSVFFRLNPTGQGWRLRRWRNLFLCRASILLATLFRLPGIRFAWFGLKCARECRDKGSIAIAADLSVTPVNCIRYFEFDFALRAISNVACIEHAVDISSPNLFGLYLINGNRVKHLDVINPDLRDLDTTRTLYATCAEDAVASIEFHRQYVQNLNMPDESVDVIWSLSVIEHIPEPQDETAVLQVQRMLRPGGLFVISVPVRALEMNEYRAHDCYGLSAQAEVSQKGVFFQRWYDAASIKSRICDKMPEMRLESMALWGEVRPGWFDNYTLLWGRNGADETCKDAFHMLVEFQKVKAIERLPGAGVACMLFRKHT